MPRLLPILFFLFVSGNGTCTPGPVDIVFVLDRSGSVGSQFYQEIEFSKKVISKLPVSVGENGGSRVGVVVYSNRAEVELGFDLGSNLASVMSKFSTLSSTQGSGCTNTTGALKVAGLNLLNVSTVGSAEQCHNNAGCCTQWSSGWTSSGGSSRRRRSSTSSSWSSSWSSSTSRYRSSSRRQGRSTSGSDVYDWSGGRRVLVIVSDGASNLGGDPSGVASELSSNGIELFSVGVGSSVTEEELLSMASTPKSRHMFRTSDFNGLSSVVGAINEGLCGCK